MKTIEEIQDMLDTSVNELIKAHGGYVEVVGLEHDYVHITMNGGCQGCAGAKHTMKLIVSRAIKEFEPAINDVFDVTDHDKGQNPYFERVDDDQEEN